MDTFTVLVRNELTGESCTVEVRSDYFVDAQVEALHTVFHTRGWRKVVAALPDIVADAQAS
ncbi:MAG TPA: hypothetical protein VFA78_04535 [Chloroflexota bacterium]|nr:hypothetical protein [Chloroflexota bacterium]